MSFQTQQKQSNLNFGIFIFISIVFHSWLLIHIPDTSSLRLNPRSDNTLNIELSAVTTETSAANNDKQHASERMKSASNNLDHRVQKKTKAINQSQKKQVNRQIKTALNTSIPETDTAEILAPDNSDDKYLEQVFRKIESHKYYPRAAQRRGMEEIVMVSFNLLSSGNISDLEINARFKPLRLAATNAVKQSLPFDSLPDSAKSPLKIQYAMAFALQ